MRCNMLVASGKPARAAAKTLRMKRAVCNDKITGDPLSYMEADLGTAPARPPCDCHTELWWAKRGARAG